jgi:hypothetical protein
MNSGLPGWPSVTPEGRICASGGDTIPAQATPKLAGMSDEINAAQEAWLSFKINLA